VCASQFAAMTAWAGDRVIFSSPSNTIAAPSNMGKESKLDGSIEGTLKRPTPSEFETPMTPMSTANPLPNRSLESLLDRHRNWAFATPETALVKSPSLNLDPEAALAIKDPTPKRAVELYLDSQKQSERSSLGAPGRRPGKFGSSGQSAGISDLRNGLTRPSGNEPSLDNAVSMGLFTSPFDRNASDNSSSSVLTPMVYPSTAGQSPSASDSGSVDSMTSTTKPKRPLSPLPDPINLLQDLTSESLQPVIGVRKNELGRNTGLVDIDGVNAANRQNYTRKQDPLTARVLGPSSLAPAIAPIDPSRMFSPPPTVLEIPKRRF
jgi:hypothetical protein